MPLNSLSSQRPRILLVDDNDVIRAALRAVVEHSCEVIGEARDGREAVIHSTASQPDVVLLDISLPDSNGYRVLQEIRRCSPRSRIIFVSTHSSEPYVREAFRLGASGYVSKSKVSTHLLPAIHTAVSSAARHSVTRSLSSIGGQIGHQVASPAVEVSLPVMTEPDTHEMISPTSRMRLLPCNIAQHLLDQFAGSVKAVLQLLEKQFDAVVSGDPAANRFDLLIHEANERKQDAKYAYLRHLQLHGCDARDESGSC